MTVYMIVTRDKYRLPRWWGTTTAELAQLSGRKHQNVRFAIGRQSATAADSAATRL